LQKTESLSRGEKIIRDYIEKIRTERLKARVPDEEMLLEIRKLKEKKTPEVEG